MRRLVWVAAVSGVLSCGCMGSNGASPTGHPQQHQLPASPRAYGTTSLPGGLVYAAGNGTDIRIFESSQGDGSQARLLVGRGPGLDMAPHVSPDGRRLVYRHNPSPTSDRSDVFILDLVTGRTRNVTRSAQRRNWGASWSPDGRSIVFNRTGASGPELWLIRPDGRHAHRIAAGWAEYPRFSPDGTTIVFESRRDGNYEIYTIHPDGSGLRRLTHTTADDKDPSFSPNGRLILFTSERDSTSRSSTAGSGFETPRQVYLMNADGSHQHALVRDRASDELPTFLPDGRVLFFSIQLPAVRDAPPHFLGAFVAAVSGQVRRTAWPRQEVEIDWRPR